ncbi:sensor histidine kinase [Bacillus sp. 2205SS5-2]|uniref:sensor histidine kinase n=1 Tax=Bacillus sp. 2205SS5-2 TaxID=3109031 RepID=UPI003003E636
MKTLAQKLWISLLLLLLLTIGFAYLLSDILYERLYVNNVEEELIDLGEKIRRDYKQGEIADEFIQNVEWLNSKTPYEVFAVRNPRELSACVPFDIDYQALIGPKEREQLLLNKTLSKVGYEERFDRKLVSVVVPLLEENRLQGIIYLYFPLADITELTSHITWYWLLGALIFILTILYVGTKGIGIISRPIKEMRTAAVELAKGKLNVRVSVSSNDEVGQLALTFNKMAEALEEEDQRNKEFLATVSHELRTPLSYIKGYLEGMKTGVIAEEKREHYVNIMSVEASRMEKIVGDLLELMKMETTQFSIEKVPLVFAETIRQTTKNLQSMAEEKGLNTILTLDEEIIILGDEARIQQIIYNVFVNSMHHTESGSISITLANDNDSFAKLMIEDTGSGIPEEDLPHVTERFYRVNKARSRKDGGTGLGLSIVNNLVLLHGGKLSIESQIGKGTKVSIYIPLVFE